MFVECHSSSIQCGSVELISLISCYWFVLWTSFTMDEKAKSLSPLHSIVLMDFLNSFIKLVLTGILCAYQ